MERKNHSQAHRSKAGQFLFFFFDNFSASWQGHSLFVSLLSMIWEHWFFFHWVTPASDLQGKSPPCSAMNSLQTCWLQDKKRVNSPAKLLASEPDAFVLDCNLHTQQFIWSSVRCQIVWFQFFSKKNLVSWTQWFGVIGDVFWYERIYRSPEPFRIVMIVHST